jgi:hypothetical protein
MSARIVVNLAEGVASVSIDRAPDGGLWLSMCQPREAVIVKLAPASLQSLAQALATDLDAIGTRESEDHDADADGAKPPLPADAEARSVSSRRG